MNDPRSDEHRFPEGDENATPTRPFIVAADLSHYVVREVATGRSLTKRCTFDEADHACNLLNYGWRACAKQAREEMDRQKECEARERALYMKQIVELKAMVYHTPPGQLEYAPEGWTWRQEAVRLSVLAGPNPGTGGLALANGSVATPLSGTTHPGAAMAMYTWSQPW